MDPQREHSKKKITADEAVTGFSKMIEPCASRNDEINFLMPLVIVALEDVLPAGVFVDFVQGDPGFQILRREVLKKKERVLGVSALDRLNIPVVVKTILSLAG